MNLVHATRECKEKGIMLHSIARFYIDFMRLTVNRYTESSIAVHLCIECECDSLESPLGLPPFASSLIDFVARAFDGKAAQGQHGVFIF
mmetsp:Transcript_4552/g.8156  ORF Transcript_4552/g.8156 Transcript_4552/m.8156 type:complete len:89 (-) Transcript_4552:132-398(-)